MLAATKTMLSFRKEGSRSMAPCAMSSSGVARSPLPPLMMPYQIRAKGGPTKPKVTGIDVPVISTTAITRAIKRIKIAAVRAKFVRDKGTTAPSALALWQRRFISRS